MVPSTVGSATEHGAKSYLKTNQNKTKQPNLPHAAVSISTSQTEFCRSKYSHDIFLINNVSHKGGGRDGILETHKLGNSELATHSVAAISVSHFTQIMPLLRPNLSG